MQINQHFSRRTLRSALVFCVIALFTTINVHAQDEADIALLDRSAKAFASVVKKAGPAVVHVAVEKAMTGGMQVSPHDFFNDPFFERFFGPQFKQPRGKQQPRQYRQQGAGSGFIFDSNGYILTNNHVVEGAEKITVRLDDKREFKAKVIGTDPQSDVAIIKIDGTNLPTLPLGNSDNLEVGEWVIAIGSPFELNQTVTVGVVSAKGRNRVGITDYENFIQTDAAINPGNSGGPLLNIHGEAIGLNTAIFSKSGGYMGIGFAIPINMAQSIKQQLLDHGKVTRGWLGVVIQDVTEDLADSFGLDNTSGVLIAEVSDDSPAAKAGLKQGDVLVALDTVPLANVADLRNKIAMTPPDSKVSLKLIRDGKTKNISVTIGQQPANMSARQPAGTSQTTTLGEFGLSLQELTPELAEQFEYEQNQGVLITAVEPDSPAGRIGLQAGQLIEEVNRQQVDSLSALKKVLSSSKNKNQVLLRIRSGKSSQYVVLRNE
ncbi:DegQ family serine endoprotease [Desulfogranum marinum]|jgi:serine protease Do|uniref:DegQ family serine endoprotease n=1 Tax=Desulfogranum marinum TaxID=453220 RepID=UPI001966BA53|nr:DegQ family serine endoprotease [Desulfogranum marinum]MBM9512697.1 DegQ family serine endoprotease [Desulfogranum marinum]